MTGERTKKDRLGAATHEAGHAVVAWSLGLSVGEIEIGITGDDTKGKADIGADEHLRIVDRIAICLAGIEAQVVFDCPTHELAGFSDYAKVAALVEGLSEAESLELRNAGSRHARDLIITHKVKLQRLAARLVDRGAVNGAEFALLMEPTRGEDIEKLIDAGCADGWDPANDGWDDLSEVEVDETAPPLVAHELKSVHEDLARRRSPADFRKVVAGLHKRCRSWEIFKNPRQNFLLDAWTLAEFVRHQPVDQVWLAGPSEQWPDGYVCIGKKIENVEVTIALTDGRRMADEYRPNPGKKMELDPVDNWAARAEGIPAALERAIEAKIAKRYGSRLWLVVYLNIGDGGIRQREMEQAIATIKHQHKHSFDGLFVIWKDKLL
jgi:hypothetical protein